MRARGFSPCASPNSRLPISSAAAPSTMPEELPAWWTWLIRSRCGIFHDRDLVEAGHHLAHVLEGGLQRAKRLHVGAGAHVFVVVEDRQAVLVRIGTTDCAKRPSSQAAAARFWLSTAKASTVVAGEAVFGGDDVGGDALRHEIGLHRERRVDGDRGAVRAHRHPAHHLDAAGDIAVAGAAAHLVGGEVHRLEPAGAEAVDREAGDASRRGRRAARRSARGSRPARRPG